jgi:Rieske 2Fe-2S family protein
MTRTDASKQESREERPPEFSPLPREYYVSREWHERDLERIFRRQWLFAGFTSQIRERGDFCVFELCDDSVIIVRADDDTLSAFHNVCRHRGTRLCSERFGHVKKSIVCEYHGWSYALDGSLRTAPKMPPDFDRETWSLKPVWVEDWNGIIFINFADDRQPSVAGRFANVDLSIWDLARTKVVMDREELVPANWKLVSENFIECYHCSIVHPELCKVFDPALSVVGPELAGTERSGAAKLEKTQDVINGRAASEYYVWSPNDISLRRGMASYTLDGRFAVRRLLGSPDRPPTGGAGLIAFPNFEIVLVRDYIVLFSWKPASPTETWFRTTWCVHEEAVEGADYELDRLVELMDITVKEDARVQLLSQQGVSSNAYEPGPYNTVLELGAISWMAVYHKIHATQ